MTGPEYPHRPDGAPSPADAATAASGDPVSVEHVDSGAPTTDVGRDGLAGSDPTAQSAAADERAQSRPTSGPIDPHDDTHEDTHPVDRSPYSSSEYDRAGQSSAGQSSAGYSSAGDGSPTTAFQPRGNGSSPYRVTDSDATASDMTPVGTAPSDATTVMPAATLRATPPATAPRHHGAPAVAPMMPPGGMASWQSTPHQAAPGTSADSTSTGSTSAGSTSGGSAIAAEPGTFFGQSSRAPESDLAPPKSRIWQNLLGAVAGLVLVLGPVILFAVLAGTPDSLFEQSTGRRLVVLGMIVIAALSALLAGWAPAAAWLPGGLLALAGTIALFSPTFVSTLQRWSTDLFGTPVVGVFITTIGLYLGFALLFAGLGTVWARRSGVDSVLDRLSPQR